MFITNLNQLNNIFTFCYFSIYQWIKNILQTVPTKKESKNIKQKELPGKNSEEAIMRLGFGNS